MDLELAGRLALITGANGAIGRACAEAFVAEGAKVRLSGRDAATLASAALALGPAATYVAGDLRDAKTLDALVPDGDEPDIVVHAAGHRFAYGKLHAEEDDADARALHDVDFVAFVQIARRSAPAMMARRFGRFVAVTSLHASVGGLATARYAATKAALEGVVRALAVDYGRFGITANAVAPGVTATERLAARTGGDTGELAARTSVKKVATPAEIAAPIVFLCSPRASYVTGATLAVTGGLHLSNTW